ncbi:hypothetical protein [Herbaspirillum rubrisubalbicans]|nr:hypothetical protein [Herbaspirillum rubrisubalbicans]
MHIDTLRPCSDQASLRGNEHHGHQRRTRRWCMAGLVGIPLLLGVLWQPFVVARGGPWFYADHLCDCREVVSLWVWDYVWTQMIWLPGNALFLLIWSALAIKLWNCGRSAR